MTDQSKIGKIKCEDIMLTLLEHAHAKYRDFFQPKSLKFHLKKKKKMIFFTILLIEVVLTSTQQSKFWFKNKKNKYTTAYPSFVI